jgi:hypothetical protein
VDYLDDLEADFLALYRVEDMMSLSGARWLRLAMRTVAYQGVMAVRAQALTETERHTPAGDASTRRGRRTGAVPVSTSAAIAADPVLSSVVSVGKGW